VGSFGYRRGREMSTPPRLGPREYATDEIVVEWHPALCFHSLNCVKALAGVFDSARRPWIDLGQTSADEIEAQVDGCPSAALRSRRVGATGPAARRSSR
jgi:uncharacterized Fe-S cluster protein YjdI